MRVAAFIKTVFIIFIGYHTNSCSIKKTREKNKLENNYEPKTLLNPKHIEEDNKANKSALLYVIDNHNYPLKDFSFKYNENSYLQIKRKSEELNLAKIDIISKDSPVNPITKPKIIPEIVKKGTFYKSPIKFAPIDITVKTTDSYILPDFRDTFIADKAKIAVRTIDNFSQIKLGTQERALLAMSSKQFDDLNLKHRMERGQEIEGLRIESIEENNGTIIIQLVEASHMRVYETFKKGQAILFDLQSKAHSDDWLLSERLLQEKLVTTYDPNDSYRPVSTHPIENLFDSSKTGLGKGAYGEVRLIEYEGQRLVIKKMSAAENLNEVAVLLEGSCKDCLQYYGARQINSDIYLISEFAENGELYARIYDKSGNRSKGAELSTKEVRELLSQAQQLTDVGLITTDIKLNNILIGTDGKLKLMDFGMAKRNPNYRPQGGSDHTIAPEIKSEMDILIDAKDMDKVMVYSLGLTIIEAKSSVFARNIEKVRQNNEYGESNVDLLLKNNSDFTENEKAILAQMIEPNIKQRIGITDALEQWNHLP